MKLFTALLFLTCFFVPFNATAYYDSSDTTSGQTVGTAMANSGDLNGR